MFCELLQTLIFRWLLLVLVKIDAVTFEVNMTNNFKGTLHKK